MSESLRFCEFQKKGDKLVSFLFRQRQPGARLYLTWVVFIGLLNYLLLGHLSKKVLEMTCFRICLGLGILGEALRKWGFSLHQMLRRSKGNSMIRYLNTSYLEGEKNGVKLHFWLVVKQQILLLARIGEYMVI